ncbi:M10 family metallopeptidase [Pararhizobium sp. O133]|uniref:M10 family metallopeptidase n=1 Tax=Pararhizobium sp. O133 TaxID=3449278 RepID=UPI003F68898E
MSKLLKTRVLYDGFDLPAFQPIAKGDFDPLQPFESDVRQAPATEDLRNFDGATVSVAASGVNYIDGLLSGVRWNLTSITFSFPDEASDYEAGYAGGAPAESFGQLSASQQAILRSALDGNTWRSIDGFTTLQTVDNGISADSTLRAAYSTDAGGSAYAYYPSSTYYGGDMWFGPTSGYNYATATLGSSGYRSTLHELGHALGLKHGHESGGPANIPVPVEYNHHEFTVMPYISYEGGSPTGYTNEAGGYPQSFMMVDIAALQYMYGANFDGGDSTYTWSSTTGEMFINGVGQGAPNNGAGGAYNRIFLTIWDNGGTNDTYDASNYTNDVSIDLRPGYSSVLSTDQVAYLGGGPNGGYARGNVYNAFLYNGDLRSLVENATGGIGNDTLVGNQGDNTLNGGAGADALDGGIGNDRLDGGIGIDTMTGGIGNDHYIVDNAGDVINEVAGEGTADRVSARASYVLAADDDIEVMTTVSSTATTAINLTGNALHQEITGNYGANILRDGAGAADLLKGLAGNDTYQIYTKATTIVETVAGDTADRVMAAVDYTLGAGVRVEIMTTNGSAGLSGIDLTGNEFVQAITGNAGNNILNGKGGSDTLKGLGGKDTFVFNTALGPNNVDKILDFNVTDDTIKLENAIFTTLTTVGTLAATLFKDNFLAPRDADDKIIYNSNTGSLFYDADGLGSASTAVKFASLATGLSLTASDFIVI